MPCDIVVTGEYCSWPCNPYVLIPDADRAVLLEGGLDPLKLLAWVSIKVDQFAFCEPVLPQRNRHYLS